MVKAAGVSRRRVNKWLAVADRDLVDRARKRAQDYQPGLPGGSGGARPSGVGDPTGRVVVNGVPSDPVAHLDGLWAEVDRAVEAAIAFTKALERVADPVDLTDYVCVCCGDLSHGSGDQDRGPVELINGLCSECHRLWLLWASSNGPVDVPSSIQEWFLVIRCENCGRHRPEGLYNKAEGLCNTCYRARLRAIKKSGTLSP